MKRGRFGIILMIASICLMALPYGVAMTFAPSPTETTTKYFSYFSMLPLGYGNWLPLVTIFLSIMVVILLLLRRNFYKAIPVCLILSIVGNLLSWLIFGSFSWTSLAIVVLHLLTLVLLFIERMGRSERGDSGGGARPFSGS